jgi:hypothetical protein
MAEPLKILRRLNEVTTDYAVFERDQVLTEQQLNSVTEYLDDQGRLTRTRLLGVGIVGGLWPTLAGDQLSIGAGVGVTSDGDLLGLAADTIFDRWMVYDETAPAYEPFYVNGRILPLIELLAQSDRRDGKPLTELAGDLRDKLLIAFMESYENDPDLCTGGSCDNKGRTARNSQRLLLIDREIGQSIGLAAKLPTGADIATALPRVRASRVDLGTGNDAKVDVTSAERFAVRYRRAADTTFKALAAAVEALSTQLSQTPIGGLPSTAEWGGQIKKRIDSLNGTVAGIQYLHAHAKDLVAAWGELRNALFADDSVLGPPPDAFPKHLLLGPLAEPAALRTGCYPSPWLTGGSAERRGVEEAMRRFDALLSGFESPAGQIIKITPSQREQASLGERAIPIYYRADTSLRRCWNPLHARQNALEDTFGYHWTPTPEQADPNDPFAADQGSVDFYRIEGFLGQKATAAEIAIKNLIRQRNLPISVMSALAHNERRLISIDPKFRKTSLHSLHYLLRQDLVSHLSDNVSYSKSLIEDVSKASNSIARPRAALNSDYVKPMENARVQLEDASRDLIGSSEQPGPLTTRSYRGYNLQDKTVPQRLSEVMISTARAKASIGEVTRNDVVSPLDAFAGSKSHLWLDWLGDILKKRDEDAKERLLLSNLLAKHPGLEHAGGAAPGGTFVLVYNDAGDVIGDLMLPYWIDDNDESDCDEPALTAPDISVRLPRDLLPIKVIKPLDLAFDEFKTTKIMPEIKIQEDYNTFFQKSLGSLGNILNITKSPTAIDKVAVNAGVKGQSIDKYMDAKMNQVVYVQQQLQEMQAIEADPKLDQELRDKAGEQAKVLEVQLADAVSETTRYFALGASDAVRVDADKSAVYATLGAAAGQISSPEITTNLKSNLQDTAATAKGAGGSAAVIGNQLMTDAFKFK